MKIPVKIDTSIDLNIYHVRTWLKQASPAVVQSILKITLDQIKELDHLEENHMGVATHEHLAVLCDQVASKLRQTPLSQEGLEPGGVGVEEWSAARIAAYIRQHAGQNKYGDTAIAAYDEELDVDLTVTGLAVAQDGHFVLSVRDVDYGQD